MKRRLTTTYIRHRMLKGEEQQTMYRAEPATSRPIADPLSAEPWSLPASICPLHPWILVRHALSRASFEPPTPIDVNYHVEACTVPGLR